MKLMKSLVLGLLSVLLVFSIVGCSSEEGQEKVDENKEVAAMVGDTPIYQEEVDLQMDYMKMMMELQYGAEYKENVEIMAYLEQQEQEYLNYLIETQLLTQKAKELDFAVNDEDIQAEYDKAKANYDTEEAFIEALNANALDEESFKERIKEGLMVNQLIEQYTADVTVTDEEIETYYNENLVQFTTGAGADMAHILVATEEEAIKVKEEYDNGASFEDLAAQYGTDGTKDQGGALGFVTYDDPGFDADFRAGAAELEEGQVSEPVKTQFGWHLIKVTNLQEEVVMPLEDAKVQISESLTAEKKNEIMAQELETLKEEITVEIMTNQEVKEEE
ncbi:peptidyl-prolyl cis-trans isomerase [Vallitalea okinawensis]|uniref:peptidyl-prolyl cis-trans isomerase n=1 Tax=Vallitalea okinawensis TaxID=2078660 RepID=UPI000CFCD68D|nr:peptidyl-prolyl cis-trans isomerase [Vallitalea okinawensis]